MKKNYLIFGLLFFLVACKKDLGNIFDSLTKVDTLVTYELSEEQFNKRDFKDRAEELIYIREYIEYKLPLLIIEKQPDVAKKAQYELISMGENPTLEEATKKTLIYRNEYQYFMYKILDKEYSFLEVKNMLEKDYPTKKEKRRIEENPSKNNDKNIHQTVGDKIYGDFNGDGEFEYAYRKLVKKGYGNPVEDGIPDEYEIQFSDNTIKPIKVGCCGFILINEDDLNDDGTDEISIIQAPMNGCSGTVSTYTIKNNNGEYLFPPYSLFWCAEMSNKDLQRLVVKENNNVYYYEADPNDENLLSDGGTKIRFERLLKKKAYLD